MFAYFESRPLPQPPNKSPKSTAMKKHYLLMARNPHYMAQAMP
jgi:hypothetical protein